jgi:hypothetical protein
MRAKRAKKIWGQLLPHDLHLKNVPKLKCERSEQKKFLGSLLVLTPWPTYTLFCSYTDFGAQKIFGVTLAFDPMTYIQLITQLYGF